MAKLEKYIKKELRKGISKARIKSALFQAGYKKEDINTAFQRFFPKKPMPPAIKYIVIALVIFGAGYVAFSLISDYLEQRPQRPIRTVVEDPIMISDFHHAKVCHAVLGEDGQYYVSRVNYVNRINFREVSYIPDFYMYFSLYKQDPSLLEDPYLKEILKEIAVEDKEYAESFERMKPTLKSIINKEITSFDQCTREFCIMILKFNKAIVEANPDYCNNLLATKLCQALTTKNRNICDKIDY